MKVVVLLTLLFSLLNTTSVKAQYSTSFFQPLSWEQASLIAARENKLVLVEFGNPKQFSEKKLLADQDLLHYLRRNVVAIRLTPDSPQGKEFSNRLLMYEPPMFAFLMPYGELLTWVSPDVVVQNPSILRESFEKAREMAEIKKRNSRSVRFENFVLKEALENAAKTEKPVALYFFANRHQPSLLLEKNVLNLDVVADLYNQQFINIREEFSAEWEQKYGTMELPAIVFLNAQGKIIYRSGQLKEREEMLQIARTALKRAEGLEFRNLSQEQALQMAKIENKALFIHYFRNGNAYKEVLKTVFADPDVVDFFERHFINVAIASDQNRACFFNSSGEEEHRVCGEWGAMELLYEAQAALKGEGLKALNQRYVQGGRQADFLERYLAVLGNADEVKKAAAVAKVYFGGLAPDCLLDSKYWNIFERYVHDVDSEQFHYLLSHREQLYGLYGEERVRQKERSVWISGAESFVKGSQFDETGFKEYTKRLKREKIENWRAIARDARMLAAEKLGDWKTFISMAEIKWNEEKLADAELYRWGNMIYEKCQNEDLRYKMAQWLAGRAIELEHLERTRGKSTITSYRGFFEKLANDLLYK